jgi:hypothetical protein
LKGAEMDIKYKVEVFSIEHNCWLTVSWHTNREYADINFDVLKAKNNKMRMIYEGKIVREE